MDLALRTSHYLDPVDLRLRRNVVLLIERGRIVETIEGAEVSGGLEGLARQTLDFDAALTLPGFVNAHCHLDLSHLAGQLPRGLSFDEWIDAVIEGRKVDAAQVEQAMRAAIPRMLATGTTSVLDISTGGDSARLLAEHRLGGCVALEVLGIDPAKAEAAMTRVDAIVRALEGKDAFYAENTAPVAPSQLQGVALGMSPHAPYSTSADLMMNAYGRCFGEGRVCTIHVAETREELQFVHDATGPLREFYHRRAIPLAGFAGYGRTPIALLLDDWFGPWLRPDSNPSLVLVHCNYPSADDLQALARAKPSVVWCPGSHDYFGHERYPLDALLKAGANLCLGTDSLASNSDLSLLEELRRARLAWPEFDALELLRMATLNGRRALGIAADAADLVVLGLPGNAPDDVSTLARRAIDDRMPVYATIARGEIAARAM